MLVDTFLICFIKIFQLFLRILPEVAQEGVGRFFGSMAYLILAERRSIAIANIRRVFREKSDGEVKDIARRCFRNLGVNFIESLLIPFIPREKFQERFAVENWVYAQNALLQNKGIMAITFHYGNWEIMGVASLYFKQEIIVLARPLKGHNRLNDFLIGLRASTGLKIIANADTAKDVIRYLRENRVVGILGDQREKRSVAVYVDLFGEKVPTSRGIAMIGMRTGSPVLPLYSRREGFLRYTLVFCEPIEMERKGDMTDLVARNTRKINALLETIILENPPEWFWVHRRWGRERKGRKRARR